MTYIHSCSLYCDRPACIKQQRDKLREALAQPEQEPVAYPEGDVVGPCIIVAQEYRARRMKPIKTKEVA